MKTAGFRWSRAILLLAAIVFAGCDRAKPEASAANANPTPAVASVDVTFVYGSEKQAWIDAVTADFNGGHHKVASGSEIRIKPVPMGSGESKDDILAGRIEADVWSPASSVFVTLANAESKTKGSPLVGPTQELVLSPVVIAMWKPMAEALGWPNKPLGWSDVIALSKNRQGWAAYGLPQFGRFKFGHTHPEYSNSGLVSLVLMAYDYHDKNATLGGRQITDPAFQSWLGNVEKNLVGASSGLIPSTGTLMNAMVQRGWSTYDCVLVYEANAIDRLRQANGRWGALRVVYPKYNLWNDHPYYVLNAPWCTPQQQAAANAFEKFLLSEPAQREAMAHGFRPANVNVPTNEPDSPFVKYAAVGIEANPPGTFREPPPADVIESLLLGWQRSQAR